MSERFKKNIQAIIAKLLFPVTKQDWYRKKGYGSSQYDSFDDFMNKQKTNEKAMYYNEFKDLNIKRKFVSSYDCRKMKNNLDSISFEPEDSKNKAGSDLHIINFYGRGEYYEMNFRDMAQQAKATGATIHAYNPPGMNSSTGRVLELNDLVNAGIAQINNLLEQGIHPDKIIMQGNCMGAAVCEEVNKHFEKNLKITFRRINSNSFKSMNSLLTNLYPVLERIKIKVKKILVYTGWYTKPGSDFLDTDAYKVYMNRQGDQTIKPKAQMDAKIKKERLRNPNTPQSAHKIDHEYEIRLRCKNAL